MTADVLFRLQGISFYTFSNTTSPLSRPPPPKKKSKEKEHNIKKSYALNLSKLLSKSRISASWASATEADVGIYFENNSSEKFEKILWKISTWKSFFQLRASNVIEIVFHYGFRSYSRAPEDGCLWKQVKATFNDHLRYLQCTTPLQNLTFNNSVYDQQIEFLIRLN